MTTRDDFYPVILPEITKEVQADHPVRYDLDPGAANFLLQQYLYEHAESIPDGMPFVCIRVSGNSVYANIARSIEARVFTEDLGDNASAMVNDFAPYEDTSYFFISVDMHRREPAGALRIVEHGPNGFMSLNDITEEPHNVDVGMFYVDHAIAPDKAWEVGTIAVLPQYRRSANADQDAIMASYIVPGLLYRSLYAGAQANNIEGFLSLIDLTALAKLRNMGIPFKDLYDLPPKVYDDGTVFQPVFARVADFDHEMRTFAKNKLDMAMANGDNKAIKRAFETQGMVHELLTGNALDDMMLFEHNGINEQCQTTSY